MAISPSSDHSSMFGDLLTRYRRHAGLTQEDLAARARLSTRGISDLERGINRVPRRDTVAALADALALSEVEREAFVRAAHAGRTAPVAAISRVSERHPARASTPLVGREREVAAIEQVLAGTVAPLLALAGEPGIGKTRLLHEACELATARGITVLWGGCAGRGGQHPYAPLLEALEHSLAPLGRSQRRAALRGCEQVAHLLPELAPSTISAPPGWLASPEQDQRVLFAAVGRFLAHIAGPHGFLLVLDDLQWAHAVALDLLGALLHAADALPLRAIVAYRDTEVRPADPLSHLLVALSQHGLAQRVVLGSLSEHSAERLAHLLVAGDREGQADPSNGACGEIRLRRILTRAGGVPLYLVRSLQTVRSVGDHGVSGTLLDVDDDPVPWDIAEMLRQRVAALPAPAREVLAAAAMIGRRAPLWLLAGVVNQPEDELADALESACTDRLLLDVGDAGYEFAHDLVREVVAAQVSSARRTLLHRRIAQVLERRPGDASVERLAFHYARSGELERAAYYLERAGDHALSLRAYADAEAAFCDAVARYDRLGQGSAAAAVRVKLGEILMTRGRFAEGQVVLAAARLAYEVAGDLDGTGRAVAQLAWGYARQGKPTAGLAAIGDVLARPGAETLAVQTRCALLMPQAFLHFISGHYSEQLAVDEAILDLVSPSSTTPVGAQAAAHRALALYMLGRLDDALQAATDVLPRLEALGDPQSLMTVYNVLAACYQMRGELDRALHYEQLQSAIAEQLGDVAALIFTLSMHAAILFDLGEWEEAEATLDRAEQRAAQAGPSWGTMYVLQFRGTLLLARGHATEAIQALSQALELAEATGDFQALCLVQAVWAEADLLADRAHQALERLTPLAEHARSGARVRDSVSVLPLLAWCHLALGDIPAADEAARLAVTLARERHDKGILVDALQADARVCAASGDWRGAVAASAEAVALARHLHLPYHEARALYRAGLIACAHGDATAAREHLAAALAILQRLGERPYAACAARALEELASCAPPTPRADPSDGRPLAR